MVQQPRQPSFQQGLGAFEEARVRRVRLRDQLRERMRSLEQHLHRLVVANNVEDPAGGAVFEVTGLEDDEDLGAVIVLRVRRLGSFRFRVDPDGAFHAECSRRDQPREDDAEMEWTAIEYRERSFSSLSMTNTKDGPVASLFVPQSGDRGSETVALDILLGELFAQAATAQQFQLDELCRRVGL